MDEDLNFNYKEQKFTVVEKMEPKVKCKIKWIQKILIKLFRYKFIYKDVPIKYTLSVDLDDTQDELEKKIRELELHNLDLEQTILDNGNFTLDLDKR